jgi:ABC-2 type transport system permease protein
VLGHLLNAGLTIALAGAAASLTDHPATAAIVTLAITVGSWIIHFIAAIHGGWWETIAGYTPTAMVAQFQHGLIRLDVLLVALVLLLAGFALAAVWIRLGIAVRQRMKESILLAAMAAVLLFAYATASKSWDLSENRMNSFSRADEQALLQIREPLRIEAHLAPEDPRRVDLERRTLSKLRRLLPRLRVEYVSSTSIGLFEQASAHYGEIWYELGERKVMSRAVTPEGVLEAIYSLASITPPDSMDQFLGHPLAVPPRGAALVFYLLWPAAIAGAGFFVRRRLSCA